MKTYIDCIPCLFQQIINTCRLGHLNHIKTKNIIDKVCKIILKNGLQLSPPEIAGTMHTMIKKMTKKDDLYKTIKKKSNILALRFYKKYKNKVKKSKDHLLTAVELAIAGNIIDFGAKHSMNIEKELRKIISKENKIIKNKNNHFFAYEDFKKCLHKAKTIIYLADNVGETVFDRILIEEIKKIYPEKVIYYTVKEKPIINDALKEDALKCGIDKYASIISSGCTIPGTILDACSHHFLNYYNKADMVISKGQGNFESFIDRKKPTFYLFMAKCTVIASEVGGCVGDINLYYNQKKHYRR